MVVVGVEFPSLGGDVHVGPFVRGEGRGADEQGVGGGDGLAVSDHDDPTAGMLIQESGEGVVSTGEVLGPRLRPVDPGPAAASEWLSGVTFFRYVREKDQVNRVTGSRSLPVHLTVGARDVVSTWDIVRWGHTHLSQVFDEPGACLIECLGESEKHVRILDDEA